MCIRYHVSCLMWHVVFAVYPRGSLMSNVGVKLGGGGAGEKMGPNLPPAPP